jgi:hypothetical protein
VGFIERMHMKTDEQELFYHKDGFKEERDGYTYAKTAFIINIMEKVRNEK